MKTWRDTIAMLADFNSVVAACIDDTGTLVAYNKAFLHLLPQSTDSPRGRKVAAYFLSPTWQLLCDLEAGEASAPAYNGLFTIGEASGESNKLPGAAWRVAEGILVLAEHDVRADELTGLGNRRAWDEAVVAELLRIKRYGGGMSVIMADLDHFRKVNDDHGQDVGDQVLCCFAELLRASTRRTDSAFRIGGEKFAVLMPHTRLAGADMIAERIRTRFTEASQRIVPEALTASFGVAEFQEGEGGLTLLSRVDNALYRAKQEGRDRVVTTS